MKTLTHRELKTFKNYIISFASHLTPKTIVPVQLGWTTRCHYLFRFEKLNLKFPNLLEKQVREEILGRGLEDLPSLALQLAMK